MFYFEQYIDSKTKKGVAVCVSQVFLYYAHTFLITAHKLCSLVILKL